jgi:PAS domain S-box-containing protein
MKEAPKHPNESKRLESLLSLNILDTLAEEDFDNITFLASQICRTPIALISLVDSSRQWFKAKKGLEVSETDRAVAFCSHAILQRDVFVVNDSSKDERFFDNPLVTGYPNVQFYAGAPLLSPDGFPLGTVCVIDHVARELTPAQMESLKALSRNVTRLIELKLNIEALEKTKQELILKATAANTIGEGIVVQDPTGQIIDFNMSALKVLSLSEEELTGKHSTDPDWHCVREDGTDFPGIEHPAMVCLKTGEPQKHVIMGVHKNKFQLTWLKVNSTPVFLKPGEGVSYAVTSFADITNEVEKNRESILKKNELRFIMDSIPHMIGVWSKELININSNLLYSKNFGMTQDEMVGKAMGDVMGEKLLTSNYPFIQRVLGGEEVSFEREFRLADNSLRYSLVTFIPFFAGHQVERFLVFVLDITQLRNLELERNRLTSHLIESSKLSSLAEMSTGIAHEINNPLTILGGSIEIVKRMILADKFSKENVLEYFESMVSNIYRISSIIKGLNTFGRDATNDPFKAVAVEGLIEDALTLCSERLKTNGIELRLNLPKLAPTKIECKGLEITQVLMSLVNNSFDAIIGLPEKWIEIGINDKNDFIELYVKDSGPGISEEVAEKIMNPFFTTKEVGKGTGLGLSIASGIAQTHHGDLKYLSIGNHTTFILRLPKLQPGTANAGGSSL